MTNEYARTMEMDAAVMANESRAGYRSDGEDFLYEIRECIGVLRKSNTGWTRELNVISWNGSSPKFDIREWDPKHEKMTKGITFTKAEAEQICKWLAARNMEPVPCSGKAAVVQTPEEDSNPDPGQDPDNVPF